MGSNNDEDSASEVGSSVREEYEVRLHYFTLGTSVLIIWCFFFFQLSIDPQAQGPSSLPSSPSCEFSHQVWSSPPPEFRDWHPPSQISQFLYDLNYVPTDLAPLNVLESDEKEDAKEGKDGEPCKLENLVDELAFHEVGTQLLDTRNCL